ncbi:MULTISPECIES: hypothetical protein [unclassified Kitasatospora]|uniref:hypothetical protein n=1 Tax=unclassified Kitasatospora TaxID=2633591 RepID=UPI0033D2F962
MSRRARRRRRATTRAAGGRLHRLVGWPARNNVRRPFIATVVIATAVLYYQVLSMAAPMPPGKAPAPPSGGAGQLERLTDTVDPDGPQRR